MTPAPVAPLVIHGSPVSSLKPRHVDGNGDDGEEAPPTKCPPEPSPYRVTDTLLSQGLVAGAALAVGNTFWAGHQGAGKIYSLLLRSSDANGLNVGAQIEIDETLRYDFLTMTGLNTRGAFQPSEQLPWLARYDILANQFTMMWTPSVPLSYKKRYALYLVNGGAAAAVLQELLVERINLVDIR